MKKIFALVMVVSILGAMVAGCGDKGADDTKKDDATKTAAPADGADKK